MSRHIPEMFIGDIADSCFGGPLECTGDLPVTFRGPWSALALVELISEVSRLGWSATLLEITAQ